MIDINELILFSINPLLQYYKSNLIPCASGNILL
jgi:hypothetical protein